MGRKTQSLKSDDKWNKFSWSGKDSLHNSEWLETPR